MKLVLALLATRSQCYPDTSTDGPIPGKIAVGTRFGLGSLQCIEQQLRLEAARAGIMLAATASNRKQETRHGS